ncbi:MAG: hypothetical protein AB7O26_09390 [Planctomycetaceae bacterium]
MKDAVIRLCREQDSFAAIAAVAAEPDPLAATRFFHEIMRDLYWKEKDLPAAIAFGRAGLQHGLFAAASIDASNPTLAIEIRSAAKGMAYDLASFTWDGWDEKGIAITRSDLEIGLDAAKTNLRLAQELKKDDLPLARAHWMLGAQQLSAGAYDSAIASFQRSVEFARATHSEGDELLARGDIAIVNLCRSEGTDGAAALEQVKSQLANIKEGEFFIEQLDTALRVFLKATGSAPT